MQFRWLALHKPVPAGERKLRGQAQPLDVAEVTSVAGRTAGMLLLARNVMIRSS